jgi:hypothetical protein
MKKMILSLLLIINSMVADSWVSGWEKGGISTYELTNKKGDTLKIYCAENYTSINLNEVTSDFLTLIDKDNMKFVGPSRLDPTSSVLTDELALDNFLYEVSNNTKFTITMGKQKAEFNVIKNNVNSEIVKECDMEKLNAMYDELNGNNNQEVEYTDSSTSKMNKVNASNWQSFIENGINTFVLLNDKADSLSLACTNNYSVILLNNEGGNKNIITVINEDNLKFETKTLIENKLFNKDASFNNFLQAIIKGGYITVEFNNDSSSFNVGINSINNEIIKNCGY